VRFNVDDHGAVHDAGLRDGDVGLALDGTAFENPRQMNALFSAAQLKAKSKLTVQRGTQRVDLELDLAKLADHLSWDLATR
jgi:type II secretory pathway component PulC